MTMFASVKFDFFITKYISPLYTEDPLLPDMSDNITVDRVSTHSGNAIRKILNISKKKNIEYILE